MQDRLIDTPTTEMLKASRTMTKVRPYTFYLTEQQVAEARRKDLPDSALLALAAITGASYAASSGPWITLSARALDSYQRSYRWWHRATAALEAAGLIQCERHAGRLPRYRLTRQRRRTAS